MAVQPDTIDYITPAAHRAVVDFCDYHHRVDGDILQGILNAKRDAAGEGEPEGWYFESRVPGPNGEVAFQIHRSGYPPESPQHVPGHPVHWTLMLPEDC
jgi:hypothetical protein